MLTGAMGPRDPSAGRAARVASKIVLTSQIEDHLDVGHGNLLALSGRWAVGASPVRAAVLALGARSARATVLPGGREFAAMIPIAELRSDEDAELAIELRFADGSSERVALARVRLTAGSPQAAGPGVGSSSRLVAICLATYDPPLELLRRQIESIRAQTHEDWTCLISDDGSPEPKLSAIRDLIGDDPRFQLSASDRRRGFYRNFERSLRSVPAAAEFVALCDQDDRWYPDKLASLIAALGPDHLLAHSDARIVDAEGAIVSDRFWPSRVPRDDDLRSLFFANAVSGASCLFRRGVLERSLPFPALPEGAYHDRWIALVASKLGSVARVERPLYDYVQHGEASLGHAMAVGRLGAEGAPGRRVARRGLLARWRSGELAASWRAEYFGPVLQTAAEARVIELRFGERMSASERRSGAALAGLAASSRADAWVGARFLRRLVLGGPGLEPGLMRGILWRRFAGSVALPIGEVDESTA